jgi:hypothetical protein
MPHWDCPVLLNVVVQFRFDEFEPPFLIKALNPEPPVIHSAERWEATGT